MSTTTKQKKKRPFDCKLHPSDQVFYGSGGSDTLIVVRDGATAFKLFPIIYHNSQKTLRTALKKEIHIAKALSQPRFGPHIVQITSSKVCVDAMTLFKGCPIIKDLDAYLDLYLDSVGEQKCKWVIDTPQFNPFMSNLYDAGGMPEPTAKVADDYYVMGMEYAPVQLKTILAQLAEAPIDTLKPYLDTVLFQICYTLVKIKSVYPNFTHGDLFIRNVMGVFTDSQTLVVPYEINGKTFRVPNIHYIAKIADFGLANLKTENRTINGDWFTLTYDIYNGAGLGSQSLTQIFKDNPKRQKWLKKYFNSFFDVAFLDKIAKKPERKQSFDWLWSLGNAPQMRTLIKIKTPDELLATYFLDTFGV